MIEERLCQLPPEEFEDVLHSVFKEDEWLLILVGALLGMGRRLGPDTISSQLIGAFRVRPTK